MEMTIDTPGDAQVNVALRGRLDVLGVDTVETKLTAAVVPSGKHAVIDMSGVTFVASLGIRMFVSLGRALARDGRKLVLHSCQEDVAEVFEMAALDQLITIAASPDDAQAALG